MIYIRRQPRIDDVLVESSVTAHTGISWAAKGLYAMMCRFREGTEPINVDAVDFDYIMANSPHGRDKLRAALGQLVDAGIISEPKPRSFVYVAVDKSTGSVKVGHTVGLAVAFRIEHLRTGNPNIELLAYDEGTYEIEQEFHRLFSKHSIGNEWFNLPAELLSALIEDVQQRSGRTFVYNSSLGESGAGS